MSSETRGSQSESVENNNNTNPSSSNNSSGFSNSNQNERSQNEFTSNNTNESIQINISETSNTNTEPPQPAITRKHHSSMSGILDEIPPPPYSKDSNMQTTSSSHSRDHTQITITSLPEYTVSDSSHSTITTQPQVIPIPSHRHSLSNDALLSSKFCKICQESESDNKNKLISPCKCKGSLQYVHIECLNQWRNSNVREDASYRCEVCKYEYKFYRPRIAKIFSNALTLHFLTLLLLLSSIYFFSYLVKLLDSHDKTNPGNGHNNSPHKFFNRWRNIHFLNLRLIHIIYGSAIVSLFGLIFFMCLVCLNGFRTARTEYCYCGGFGHPFCYGSYGCDCTGTDGDCGVIVILIALVILAVLFVFGFVGAVIAAYLFTQKIISVCLEKVHDRILEVKKD